jgi:hypothetical protein
VGNGGGSGMEYPMADGINDMEYYMQYAISCDCILTSLYHLYWELMHLETNGPTNVNGENQKSLKKVNGEENHPSLLVLMQVMVKHVRFTFRDAINSSNFNHVCLERCLMEGGRVSP